ncbi:MBOAT family protein [uncultured Adlercreutzia sp.]|uniref:MBOAT family O-acyltransferase n=1 Tax=uncultured Adlercreutzia sp. TaxID=875803 RepID=UPI0025DB2E9E|nr:MBOAT family O-acyltransferase [uncultured Adlercreutzia sp.]MCI9262895.1 MBOAT family protein [Eggerthellaceae bacterium]
MVFSSTIFLFAFFPAFLAVYFLMPRRSARNVVLLLFSLLFYAWGEPVYVWLMVFSICFNWAFGFAISKTATPPLQKVLLVLDLFLNLLILGFYKYQGFLAENVNAAIGEEFIAELNLALPIGISFFTLQAITYVVDVYRGQVRAQKNPLYLGMYIAMFPQLVAGPIVRYSDIEAEIDNRRATLEGFAQGLRLFCVGLGKKVLLANTAGTLADSLLPREAAEIGFVGCFSGVAAYTFQIYFDFSGYSDMAIGMGKMMGFDYPRNFNYPYTSRSATEFWRRWHMTLGGFFRDYVYIPLGGNRVKTPRFILNTMIVWGLTGIWHGAAWNFLLWGLYWGVLILLEKFLVMRVLDRLPGFVSHIWCAVLFFFGWLLFAVTGLGNIAEWFCAMFGAYGWLGTSTLWELQSWSYVSLVPVFIVGSLPWAPWLRKRLQAWAEGDPRRAVVAAPQKGNTAVPPCQAVLEAPAATPARARAVTAVNVAVDAALIAVFVLSAMSVVSSSYNPFIYFQF